MSPSRKPAGDGEPHRKGQFKLTDTVLKELIKHIENGVTQEVAARAIGVDPKTLRRWCSEGRAAAEAIESEDPAYVAKPADDLRIKCAEAVDKARYKAETSLAHNIVEASRGGQLIGRVTRTLKDGGTEVEERWSSGDWRAAAFILTHTRPQRWTKVVALADPDGQPLGTGAAKAGLAAELSAFLASSPENSPQE